jgi:hopene-associated glycosyltransferase HpnB
MFAELLGAASLAAWIYLRFFRGRFWLIRGGEALSLDQFDQCAPAPAVAVIVPARNEADVAGAAVRSLVAQNYPGGYHVFLVDDASTDGTAEAARLAAKQAGREEQLSVVEAGPLAAGWTGKLWALSEGLEQSASLGADYFLFADADIVHGPGNVAGLVERASSGGFDLVSLMAKLSCNSLSERALIPAFLFFFFMLYPPEWILRPERRTAAAAGGCILIRAEALARIGGLAAIRGELIDDCALARAVKRSGGRIWLGPATGGTSLRTYSSWKQIEQMISRTAFTELRHSVALLVATIAALTVVFVAPPFLALFGPRPIAAALGLGAWLLMSGTFVPTLRYYGRSGLWALLLPPISLFYIGATAHSAMLYWRGRGGLWKGRVQYRHRETLSSR